MIAVQHLDGSDSARLIELQLDGLADPRSRRSPCGAPVTIIEVLDTVANRAFGGIKYIGGRFARGDSGI